MREQNKNRVFKERGSAIVEYMPILTMFILLSFPSVALLGRGIEQKFCSANYANYPKDQILAGYLATLGQKPCNETGPNILSAFR